MSDDPRKTIRAMCDAMYRGADGLGKLLDLWDAQEAEIRRLRLVNRELSAMVDEKMDPVKYEPKEMH